MHRQNLEAKKHSSQLTIRGVSLELDQKMRKEASQRGWSLNRTVLELLNRATGISHKQECHSDLDHLFGTWSDREGQDFDVVLEDLRQITA